MGAVSAVEPESMAVGTKAFSDNVVGVAINLDNCERSEAFLC